MFVMSVRLQENIVLLARQVIKNCKSNKNLKLNRQNVHEYKFYKISIYRFYRNYKMKSLVFNFYKNIHKHLCLLKRI